MVVLPRAETAAVLGGAGHVLGVSAFAFQVRFCLVMERWHGQCRQGMRPFQLPVQQCAMVYKPLS